MKVRQFLAVVPSSFKTAATALRVLRGAYRRDRRIGGTNTRRSNRGHLPRSSGGRCDRNLGSLPGLCACGCSTARHAADPLDIDRSVDP